MLMFRIDGHKPRQAGAYPWVYGISLDYDKSPEMPTWLFVSDSGFSTEEYQMWEAKEAIVIDRCGAMSETPVTPEESEILTGLFYPASMDRLIEMIHTEIEANAFTESA